MSTAAVLLAAGRGSRFTASGGSGHKLLAPYRDRPVVEWAIEHAAAAAPAVLYVVWGATELPVPASSARAVRLVRNDRWADGIATSLWAGIDQARRDGHDAVVVGLGDQPNVRPAAWTRVGEANDRPIAIATYAGVRGNPVRLAEPVWSMLPVTGDVGARLVARDRPDLVLEVACDGDAIDIDTVDDLRTDDGITHDRRTGAEQWS
jgi:molybdenum cofactor cytidylyltransferase